MAQDKTEMQSHANFPHRQSSACRRGSNSASPWKRWEPSSKGSSQMFR